MNAKQEILSRIRSAQKQAGLPDHVDAPRDYHHEGTLNADELRDMLIDRLEDYKAEVHVTEEGELKQTIATSSRTASATTFVTPKAWTPPSSRASTPSRTISPSIRAP